MFCLLSTADPLGLREKGMAANPSHVGFEAEVGLVATCQGEISKLSGDILKALDQGVSLR